MTVLTERHSPSTLSAAPLHRAPPAASAPVCSSMSTRPEDYGSTTCSGHTVPCSGSPTAWRWQTGHKQSSSWPWKHNTCLRCVCLYTSAGACRRVCLSIHDDLFARGLQHHVLGPVVPVLVGLGLVHDLLEHRPLPGRKQNKAPVVSRINAHVTCTCVLLD